MRIASGGVWVSLGLPAASAPRACAVALFVGGVGEGEDGVTGMAAPGLPLRGALRAGFLSLTGKLPPASVRITLRRNYGVVTSQTGEKVTHTGQVSKPRPRGMRRFPPPPFNFCLQKVRPASSAFGSASGESASQVFAPPGGFVVGIFWTQEWLLRCGC